MKKLVLFVLLAAGLAVAKDDGLTATVLSAENVQSKYASWSFDRFGGGGGHRVSKHVIVECSDGNTFDLVPKNQKDLILPGTYPARLEKRDLIIFLPKIKGKGYNEVKLNVVSVQPTSAQPTAAQAAK